MITQAKWATSIDDLLRSFRDALFALVPIAERVHMAWRGPDSYDDWDHICTAVYQSIVIGSIAHAQETGRTAPMLAYDSRVGSYKKNSFICNSALPDKSAFVALETKDLPFDHSLFALLDDDFAVVEYCRLPIEEVRFVYCSRNPKAGYPTFHDAITVLL